MSELPARAASAPNAGRIEQLDILRALAALSVVWVHYWPFPRDNLAPVAPWLSHALTAGDNLLQIVWPRGWSHPGVIVFIVLSGFCIHLPQAGRPERRVELGAFFRRRFFRIYPVYFFALGLGWLANAVMPAQSNIWVQPEPWTFGAVARDVFGRSAFWPGAAPLGNTILHTVIAEMGLYLVYPALLAVVRRGGWTVVLLGTAVLSLGATAATHYGRVEWAFTSTWGFLFFWWLGAFAAEQRARHQGLEARRFWLNVTALLALYVIFNTWVRFPARSLLTGPLMADLFGPRFEGAGLITGPWFAALCMLLLWHIDFVRLSPSRFWRSLVWLGERSYSLYAVHIPVLALTLWVLNHTMPWPLWCWMIAPPAAVAAGALGCYVLIEAPGMRRGRA